MAVHVLEAETDQMIKAGSQTVVLESDFRDPAKFAAAIMELQHADTRNKAIAAAAKLGIANPRVGMGSQPYPVDVDGNTVTQPNAQTVHAYRIEVEITGKAV